MSLSQRSHQRTRRVRGFTLIELLVVVGIIIIATAMAMPAVNFMDSASLTPLTNCATFEFRKDGTIIPKNTTDVPPATVLAGSTDIYDANAVFNDIPKATVQDMVLRQIGEPSKRCFID